jgi:xanthine dehydrogenase accessory factor
MLDEFLSKATALHAEGCPFAFAIVVRHEPPVSGKAGDKAIVQTDGSVWGWIGGGCVQPLVVREALKAIEAGRPRLIRIAPSDHAGSPEGIVSYSMTCHGGGALDVYIEPVLPKPQILIFGRSLAARTLARLGKAIGYAVAVVAPGANRDSFPDADLISEELDLSGVKITPETYIVVATQGEQDEEALAHALGTTAPYLALIASQAKSRKIQSVLIEKGIAAESLSRVKAPAGLDIGTRSPEEIAVSILAEIIQVRTAKRPPVGNISEEISIRGPAPAETTDPICGMTVEITRTTHQSEYRGNVFYFCGDACKQAFDKQPEKIAALRAT